MSGVLNVTQLVGVVTSLWTMDRFGRRPLLLWGSFFMTLSHLIIAILVGKFSSDWPDHRAAGWVSVAFLLFYMLSFGASWGPVRTFHRNLSPVVPGSDSKRFWGAKFPSHPSDLPLLLVFLHLVPKLAMLTSKPVQVPWAMPSEIFPSSLRAKGVALATCSNWLNNFIIGLITPPLVINTGFGAYTFFAVFCLLSLIWVFYFVPETKGSEWHVISISRQRSNTATRNTRSHGPVCPSRCTILLLDRRCFFFQTHSKAR